MCRATGVGWKTPHALVVLCGRAGSRCEAPGQGMAPCLWFVHETTARSMVSLHCQRGLASFLRPPRPGAVGASAASGGLLRAVRTLIPELAAWRALAAARALLRTRRFLFQGPVLSSLTAGSSVQLDTHLRERPDLPPGVVPPSCPHCPAPLGATFHHVSLHVRPAAVLV